jgi:hypothetical protein
MYTLFPANRSIIGRCECCGQEIYDSNEEYVADDYYEFDGDLVCEDCLIDYCNEHFHRGGCDV